MYRLKAMTPTVALAMVLVACGAETTEPTPTLAPLVATTIAMDDMATDSTMNMEHDDDEHVFLFGEPAEESAASRVIDISTLDTFRFTPDPIAVRVGETVTFRVTNDGVVPHEVVLDDQAGQDTHELEMQEMTASGNMTMMMDEANGFSLAAGESKVLSWTFTEPGTVYLGCHQPGHYAAGMVASVVVEP